MFNWLKLVLLNRLYSKTIREFSKNHQKGITKDLKNISVILDHRLGIDKKYFKEIGTHFNIPKHNVRVLTFFESQKQINETNYNSSFTSNDISISGVLGGVLPDFCKKNSDVLINFYDQNDINLKYLSAKVDKKISIGFKSVDHSLNDLIIEVDAQNIETFISECIKYLKIFFSIKK